MAYIDRWAEPLDREFDDLNGAIDARAEAARRCDQDFQGRAACHDGGDVSDCLQPCKALPMTAPRTDLSRRIIPLRLVKTGLIALATTFALSACHNSGTVAETGVYVTRTSCPQVGIPAGTGDITLFNPAGSKDASAIDLVATITNLRAACTEDATNVVSTATFDVVATRRDAGQARQVTLPYYDVIAQGGSDVVAKKVGYVALNFPAGSVRAQTSAQTTGRVNRGAAVLPEDVQRELTRDRKPGDPDAAIDPLADPKIRDAVARATFEQLIGFQLTQDQLRYNATR